MAYVVEEDLAIAAVPVGFHELGIAAIRSLSDTREFIVVDEVGKACCLTLELIKSRHFVSSLKQGRTL